jgi:molybdopterin-containing oxidoreductase family iron-sulfur binding subunit
MPEPLNMQLNPDVTVRSRGIMEKCNFCLQRITAAKDIAKDEDRKLRDGEVKLACQSVCGCNAIVFGDLNEPDSKISKIVDDKRSYTLLAELNTRPSVSYLKKIEWDKS